MGTQHDTAPLKFFLALSVALGTLTAFTLVYSVEDAKNYRKCVERANTSPDECALIIYGR